jgi:hypothetical protein
MARLGYERYGAHGNDAGSLISPEVGRQDPERVVGVHVTQLFSFPSGDPAEFAGMSEEDQAAVQFLQQFTEGGGLAYNAYQSAQPQTLAYALQDSPAGWLAWVTQLFQHWLTPDDILTHASAYWLTGTIGSSIRRYYDDAHPGGQPTTPPPRPPGSRSSPRTSSPCAASPSAITRTSSAGTATTAAATSQPRTRRISSATTSAPSSAGCAETDRPRRRDRRRRRIAEARTTAAARPRRGHCSGCDAAATVRGVTRRPLFGV